MLKGRTIGVIGGNGWLGRAIGGSLLRAGFIDAGSLTLSSRSGQMSSFGDWSEVHWTSDNRELTERSDVIIVSVRPEQFPAVAIDAHDKLVISVMAVVPVGTLRVRTRSERIVRAMPNAAAEIGRSYTPWFAADAVSAAEKDFVQALFETCGTADELPREADIDYLTGLTGSGPAFPALLADAMLTHALSKGLPPEIARRAVACVVAGAGQFVANPGTYPAEIVRMFLDYRGTTAAGLRAMIDGGFQQAVHAGLDAAEAAAVTMTDQ
jgi:pyrroline-5-carboxylate reductase